MFLALRGGVNYCYNWLLDLLNNTSPLVVCATHVDIPVAQRFFTTPLVVSQKLCNKKIRHSEARRAEEALKHQSLSVGEGAVVLAKASYKCGEGAYPKKKGGLNNV